MPSIIKIIILIIGMLLIGLNVSAQDTLFTYFNKAYGNDTISTGSVAVLPVENNHYLLGGGTNSYNNYSAINIRKINDLGETVWNRMLDEDTISEKGMKLGSTLYNSHDGHYIMCYTRQLYEYEFVEQSQDMMAVKFDAEGQVIWKKNFGTEETSEGSLSMIPTSDDNYIIAGWQQDPWNYAWWRLVKFDEQGDTLWTKNYQFQNDTVMYIASIKNTLDGGYLVSGGISFDTFNGDSYIMKVDSVGNKEWDLIYGGDGNDTSVLIEVLADTTYIVLGGRRDQLFVNVSPYFLKLDKEGVITDEKIYENWPLTSSLQTDLRHWGDNGYISTALYKNENDVTQPKIVVLDENFDILFTQPITYDSTIPIGIRDLEQTQDGGYIITSFPAAYSPQFSWVAKFDSLGNTCFGMDCDSVVIDTTGVYNTNLALAEKDVYAKWAPNPIQSSSSQLYYLSPSTGPYTWLRIYNQMGMEVKSRRLSSYQQEALIDTRYLNNGVHIYTLETDGIVWHKGKLMVAK